MKQPRLLERDLRIVEKRKIWYIFPAVMVLLAIIFGIIWGVTPVGAMGSGTSRPFNVAIDFTGGYSMTLRLGHRLDIEGQAGVDARNHYQNEIVRIGQSLTPSSEYAPANYQNEAFGLVLLQNEMTRQGAAENSAIHFRFRGLATPSWWHNDSNEEFMEYVSERFRQELSALFAFIPQNVNNTATNTFVITYDRPVPAIIFRGESLGEIRERVANYSQDNEFENAVYVYSVTYSTEDGITAATVVVNGGTSAEQLAAITHAFTIPDPYAGAALHAGMTSATIGSELLVNAILAVTLALVLMLIYIAFRFDLSSGASAIIGLFHDLIIMVSFMVIFHIEIGVTFIAALITILGYSLNNTIILFDRVREKVKPYGSKEFDTTRIANNAARDTIFRSFATTITGLFPMVALLLAGLIGGISSIVVFAAPIIIGLAAGAYSTLFILPTSWVAIKNAWFRRQKKKGRLEPMDEELDEPVKEAKVLEPVAQ